MEKGDIYIAMVINASVIALCFFSILNLSLPNFKKNRWVIFLFGVILLFQLGKPGIRFLTGWESMGIFNPALTLLYPTFLYFYLQEILGKKLSNYFLLFLCFFPFLIFYAYFIIDGPPPPPTHHREIRKAGGHLSPMIPAFGLVVLLTYASYFFLIIKTIWKHKKEYRNHFSQDDAHTSLNWLVGLIIFMVIGWVTSLLAHAGAAQPLLGFRIPMWFNALGVLFFTFILSLFTSRQPVLYSKEEVILKKEPQQASKIEEDLPKELDAATETFSPVLQEKLELYMKTEKPFLQHQLRLQKLANDIDTTPHKLSHLINQVYGVNFFQFINQYRIEYAAELLKKSDSKNYTLEVIGNQSGFNSKTTFNNRFKEIMGKSPSQFRKEHL